MALMKLQEHSDPMAARVPLFNAISASSMFLGAQLYEGGPKQRALFLSGDPKPTTPPLHVELQNRIIQELIEPALSQATPEAFRAFWQKQIVPFRRLYHAYSVALEGADAKGNATRDEESMLASIAKAARAIGGAMGEEYARSAYLDMFFASETVARFGDMTASDAEEDGKQAGRHNAAMMFQFAYTTTILHVAWTERELSNALVEELCGGLRAFAEVAFVAARKGAALRGLDIAISADVVERVWGRPCEAMFTYLARRAPAQLSRFVLDATFNAGLRARAALAAKWVGDSAVAVPMLFEALETGPLIVQEGSIYALARHLSAEVTERLRDKLEAPATAEPIKEAIQDVLDLS